MEEQRNDNLNNQVEKLEQEEEEKLIKHPASHAILDFIFSLISLFFLYLMNLSFTENDKNVFGLFVIIIIDFFIFAGLVASFIFIKYDVRNIKLYPGSFLVISFCCFFEIVINIIGLWILYKDTFEVVGIQQPHNIVSLVCTTFIVLAIIVALLPLKGIFNNSNNEVSVWSLMENRHNKYLLRQKKDIIKK